MQSSLVQVPCTSGSPQGVLGCVQFFAAATGFAAGDAFPVCERARSGVSAMKATSPAIATSSLIESLLEALFLPEIPVNQFLGIFHALEFVKLSALLFAAIEDRVDLPRPSVDCFVFYRRFVVDVIGIRHREAFHNVGIFGLEIPRTIVPVISIEAAAI